MKSTGEPDATETGTSGSGRGRRKRSQHSHLAGDLLHVTYGSERAGGGSSLPLLARGDTYYPEPAGPPRLLRHRGCGGPVEHRFTCGACGTDLSAGDIATEPGPGLSER
jgi:hypothetical protein